MQAPRPPESQHDSIFGRLIVRGCVLLGLMAIAKLLLLLGAQNNLFQDHWRWAPPKESWGDVASFVVFNALLFISFVTLGRGSRDTSPKHIRVLNLGFILAGLMVFVFSLHNGDSNCFQPMMDGFLPFSSVYTYWTLGIFFGQPWLIAYVAVYVLLYWILWRKKSEWGSFYVLGGFAAVYSCLNLSWIMVDKRTLVVIDCFGVASLVSAALNRRKTLSFAVQCLPLALLVAVWFFLRSRNEHLASPSPYLMIIFSFTLLFFLLPAIPIRVSPIARQLSHWLPFFFASFLLFANHWYPLSNNYNKLIVYGFSLPHYLFGEALVVVLLCALTWLLWRWMGRKAFWMFDLVAIFLILLAAVDVKLEQTISSRLDWGVLTQCDSLGLLLRTLQPYWMESLAGLLAAALIYASAIVITRRVFTIVSFDYSDASRRWIYLPVFLVLVGLLSSIMISPGKMEGFALTNTILTSPWMPGSAYEKLSPEEFSTLVTRLHLVHPAPTGTTIASDRPLKKLNVLLIVLESTYNKYLSLFGYEEETQPLLKKYKDRMEIFPNFYSVYPNSFHARFTVLSGLYPTRQAVSHVNPHIDAKSLLELLHDQGYLTSVYQSDPREYLRFNDYLANRGVDSHYDCANMPGKERFETVSWGIPEQATMEAITNRFSTLAKDKKPFFVSYFPVAPHMPYDTSLKDFKKFPSKIQPFIKMDYSGEYKNTLLYIDWILASMLESLEREGALDNTLVVITNDHGEMIGDEGGKLGHGWQTRPDLCTTPLIILNPSRKGYHVNYTLGSQVDLLPTMASLLHIALPSDDLYEGNSLYDNSANDPQKTVYLNSSSQHSLVQDRKYYWEESPGADPIIYKINFQGTKTVFEKSEEKEDVSKIVNDFDQFQNSLIRNYHSYKKQGFAKMMTTTNSGTVSASLGK